jgi:hypothetical protein
MKSRSLRLFAFAGAMLQIASPAAAAPREHVLSWAACKSATGFQNSVSFAKGGLHYVGPNNPEGPYEVIQCSIVRDNVLTTNGLAGLEVTYTSGSTVPGDQMMCQLTSFTDRWKANTPTTSISKVGPVGVKKVLSFGASELNMSVAYGKYELLCELPSDTTIFSIYYKEN